MKLKLDTENSCFEDCKNEMIVNVLKDVIKNIENGYNEKAIFDINGNNIGKYSI